MRQETIPERFQWALKILAIHPTDHILEIGCGTGILVEQMARLLTTGTVTAVDQSATLIAKAVKRNQEFIEAKRTRFLTTPFANAPLLDGTFDKIVSFNVSLFWGNPSKELQLVKKYLKPDGTLYVFHQPPKNTTRLVADQTVERLENNAFVVEQVLFKDLPPAAVSCILSKPA